jgi:hypothetical protein
MQELTKTRTKTFRFNPNMLKLLKEASARAKMTESELVNEVLSRRLLIDPLVPKFHCISLDSDTMQSLLGASNVDVLETSASDLAQKNFPVVRRLYKTMNRPIGFIDFLTIVLSKSGQWFYIEGIDGNTNQELVLRHPYGIKWSRYLKSYLLSSYYTISKSRLKIEIDDQFVLINFLSS